MKILFKFPNNFVFSVLEFVQHEGLNSKTNFQPQIFFCHLCVNSPGAER